MQEPKRFERLVLIISHSSSSRHFPYILLEISRKIPESSILILSIVYYKAPRVIYKIGVFTSAVKIKFLPLSNHKLSGELLKLPAQILPFRIRQRRATEFK